MNIKQHAINFTSNTLSAVALVGAIALVPAQAKADDGLKNILSAVVTMAVINEVFNDRTDKVNRVENVYGSEHNPLNERHRPGYASGANDPRVVCGTKVIRHKNYAEQVKVNCFGQVLSTRIIRR